MLVRGVLWNADFLFSTTGNKYININCFFFGVFCVDGFLGFESSFVHVPCRLSMFIRMLK